MLLSVSGYIYSDLNSLTYLICIRALWSLCILQVVFASTSTKRQTHTYTLTCIFCTRPTRAHTSTHRQSEERSFGWMLLRDLTGSPFRISCKVHITDTCQVSLVKATESNILFVAQSINSLLGRENIQGTGITDYHQSYFDHYQHSPVMSRPADELILTEDRIYRSYKLHVMYKNRLITFGYLNHLSMCSLSKMSSTLHT